MAPAASMHGEVTEYIQALQNDIVTSLEKLDPNAGLFHRDSWTNGLNRGISCVYPPQSAGSFDNPNSILEKAGVLITIATGALSPNAQRSMRSEHANFPIPEGEVALPFHVAGLSLVIHPRNPFAPTVHANYRYFEILDPTEEVRKDETSGEPLPRKVIAWWFGGGCDLTPSYINEEDCAHFHSTLKAACNTHDEQLYTAFKPWCDEYFYIPHRKETRGVGGIFFDDLSLHPHKRLAGDGLIPKFKTQSDIFAFVKACADSFIPSYIPILERRMNTPFDDRHRRWQLIRRGRYVEFNLMYDRGTKFGLLAPNARYESILMSIPETARWEYRSDLGEDENTEEGKFIAIMRKPCEWAK